MPISAGRLNKRIELQETVATRDEYGEKPPSWLTTDHLWASIEPITGRELFAAHQVHAEVSHRIVIRNRPGLTSKMRFVFGSRVFNIATPPLNVGEGNESIEVLCVEVEGEVV